MTRLGSKSFFAAVFLSAGLVSGCAADPCQDYVDYMCSCHDAEGDQSCSDLKKQFEDADPELQDQCAVSLDDQKQQDADNGEECTVAA